MHYTKEKETDPEIRRRELVEGHVTAIEKANKLSLTFQNYLINILPDEITSDVIQNIRIFLRPDDLEEVSVERSSLGICGSIFCNKKISLKTHNFNCNWKLDSKHGNIIKTSTLTMYCSTICYYQILNFNLKLSDISPHLRFDTLKKIEEWLDQKDSNNINVHNKSYNHTETIQNIKEKIISSKQQEESNIKQISINDVTKEQENEHKDIDKTKQLAHILKQVTTSRKYYKCDDEDTEKNLKVYEYPTEDIYTLNSDLNNDYSSKNNEYDTISTIEILETNMKFQDEEDNYNRSYTFENMNEILLFEQNTINLTKLSSKYYSSLSSQAIVIDLLTSLVSKKTYEVLYSVQIRESLKFEYIKKSQENNNDDSTLWDIQELKRKEILQNLIINYIKSFNWNDLSVIRPLFLLMNTFNYSLRVPNLNQNTAYLLIAILYKVLLDKKINKGQLFWEYINILDKEIICKLEYWIRTHLNCYDSSVIQNIVNLFIHQDLS
ncbi:uncharacterized protein CMU_006370 [Cryptosporidium muris RN66]|uniref:RNA polymerase II subunit B1 CTD phosphatase RPAP2 homolog n=1 Tax=Cryptosporidium muris (strain RN66) TaxID=441375 RepID=B6AHL9_CRYMR|nr:uncharacterized protein CMU_006370 [Cryptosporidium muris RN66]EEA07714.1 hypothetical protein, conserved [Cryptosporidium muris RN66]|eukprot:XP_002142063.1 hypothetical protein [Cryptosporidium muris RN66]